MDKRFIEEVIDFLKEAIPNAEITDQANPKSNGVVLTGICIRENESDVAPVYNLENYIDGKESITSEEIANKILQDYGNLIVYPETDKASEMLHYEAVKDRLFLIALKKDWNQELLDIYPYKEFLDLIAIVAVDLSKDLDKTMNCKVTYEILNCWGIDFEEVYQQAYRNRVKDPYFIKNIVDLLYEGGRLETIEFLEEPLPMYVITNQSRMFGGSRILDTILLRNLAETVFYTDLLILPSSIHEIIVLPYSEAMEPDYFAKTIQYVNANEMKAEERLSDHAYIFNREKGQILDKF